MRDTAGAKSVTPAPLALAWVLRLPDVIAVVEASTPERVGEDRAALENISSPRSWISSTRCSGGG